VQNNVSNPITDTLNWVLISDTIIAQGGEQYITIGNFMQDSLSDTLFLYNQGWHDSYYFIDDVSVIDIATMGISQISSLNTQILVYPNPSKGQLTIDAKQTKGHIVVYNPLGEKLYEADIDAVPININLTSSGVYQVVFTTTQGVLTKKVVVTD
jgi:hypothetical protein